MSSETQQPVENEKDKTKAKEDDDMTPEQRMAWLRERGIQIETAEERRAKQIANIMKEKDEDIVDLNNNDTLSYVMIPTDINQPLQEFQLKIPVATATAVSAEEEAASPPTTTITTSGTSITFGGDILIDHLKTAFSCDDAEEKVDLTLLPDTTKTLTSSSTPIATATADTTGTAMPSTAAVAKEMVSHKALQQVAKQGNVETFKLVNPTASNNYMSVNMYLDEIGMLKRLPINKRASELAKIAGYNPPPIFYGDIYISRFDQRAKKYLPVTVQDLQLPYSKFIQNAEADNLQYQMEMNSITQQNSGAQKQQAMPVGSDGKEKEEEEGKYTWTQTEEEIELILPLVESEEQKDISKKSISVKFASQSISVSVNKAPIIALPLFQKVDIDGGCTWTLEKQKKKTEYNEFKLILSMEKVEPGFWPRIQE